MFSIASDIADGHHYDWLKEHDRSVVKSVAIALGATYIALFFIQVAFFVSFKDRSFLHMYSLDHCLLRLPLCKRA